jgi:putative thymidine phosphorylase
MELKAKNFNWLAGRPVVIIDAITAKKLNVHADERVLISIKNKKIYAVVDIFSNLVRETEIGLSNEISSFLKVKSRSFVEVSPAELAAGGILIKKKLNGEELTKKEISTLVSEISHNTLTESEIAYFVAAEKLQGMSFEELKNMTSAMVENGVTLKFNKKIVADKHSIGGIAGNRTTPIVVSICAAAGLTLPKNSSRAVTSAAGTADVLETISRVEFSPKEIKSIVQKAGACLVWGGSLGLAPSDDKIIHVERILKLDIEPQLLASIMSKKIAAGSNHVLIDIPYGKGSKAKTKKDAERLSKKFHKLAKIFKVKIKVVFTDGRQPIGKGIGPVLEMLDVLAVLRNKESAPSDLKEKSIYLAAELLSLCGIKNSKKRARDILESGEAYEKFREIINTQNGKNNLESKIKALKLAKFKKTIKSRKTGGIKEINNKKINSLCRVLGCPENKGSGVYLHKHLGKIKKREKLITLYSESKDKLKDALKFFKEFKPILITK